MADFKYQLESELLIVPICLTGRKGIYDGMFVLDTGSSSVIIDHTVAFDIGYSARDGVGFSTVASAVGKEKGYRLIVKEFEALGKKLNNIEVRCHDLKEQGVEGLIGMSFLKRFKWCVDPEKQIISTKEPLKNRFRNEKMSFEPRRGIREKKYEAYPLGYVEYFFLKNDEVAGQRSFSQ